MANVKVFGRVEEWTDGWMDGWTDGQTREFHTIEPLCYMCELKKKKKI